MEEKRQKEVNPGLSLNYYNIWRSVWARGTREREEEAVRRKKENLSLKLRGKKRKEEIRKEKSIKGKRIGNSV